MRSSWLRRSRPRLAGLATIGLLASLLAAGSSTLALAEPGASTTTTALAPSATLADKQAEARRISDRLDELNLELEQLAESYNAARMHLDDVQSRLGDATRRRDAAEADAAARRQELAVYAVGAYVHGGDSDLEPVLLEGQGPEVGRRIEYVRVVSGQRQELIERYRAAQADLATEVGNLDAEQAEAERLQADLDAQKSQAEARAAEQEDLLSGVQGEMADLVHQEDARKAVAQQAAAVAGLASTGGGPAGSTTGAPAVGTAPAPGGPGPTPSADPPAPTGPAPAPAPSPPPAPAPAPGPQVPSPLPGAGAAVAAARAQLGVPYVWAGYSPSMGFDCSGLVQWAWAAGGRYLPHNAEMQYNSTVRISADQLQPGDLIFYFSPIHHVGIYIGGGQMIDAPHTGDVVRIESIYVLTPVAFGRVV